MKKVRMISDVAGMSPYLADKDKGIFGAEKRSALECYVCPKCGTVEFKAENPTVFVN